MNLEPMDFVHPNHLTIFIAAARHFNCHILVRKTGRAALSWVGRRGYTGKRADLKAKTADLDSAHHRVAGLVCSPWLLPQVFSTGRLASARREWEKSRHLITEPGAGFDDDHQPRGCRTPYLVQTDRNHRHYGCVALVDMGLLRPRYVHGDYDLYAIIPAGRPFDPDQLRVRQSSLGSTMAPASLGLRERLQLTVPNMEGPLSFRVAAYINNRIAGSSPDLLGALMVNHGEQVGMGEKGHTLEPVLAVMARQVDGQWTRILATAEAHRAFYQSA